MGAFVRIEKKKEKETSAQSTVASGKKGSFVQIGDTSAIGKMEGASFGPKTETKTETKKATIAKPGASQQKRSTNPMALSLETDTGTNHKKAQTGTELISDTKRKYGSYTTKKQAQSQLDSAARITGGLTSQGTGVAEQTLKAYQSAMQEESRQRKKAAQKKVQQASDQIVQAAGGMGAGSVGAAQTTPYQKTVQRYKQAVAEETGLGRELYILEKSAMGQEQDTFKGQFSANYNVGRLTQDESLAWNDYLNDPTPENRAYAEAIGELLGEYVDKNGVLDEEGQIAPWLSKSLANYLPQFFDQTKAQVKGGLLGGAAGFAVGTAVPGIGNAAGLAHGVKAGVVAASGKYSYDTMRGAAFKSLLDLGLSEEQARDAANDEALISAMIEMGDTAIDILTLGGGKLLNTVTKGGSKALAGKLAANETTKGLMKVLGFVGTRYTLNVLGEGVEEEAQESVSMANENRVLDGTTGNGKKALARSAWDIYWDFLTGGLTEEQKQRIQEAGDEGRRIAIMLGGATLAVNETVNHSVEVRRGKTFRSDIANGVQTSEDAAFEAGRVLGGEAGELAEKLQGKWTSGGKVSDAEMGRLLQANEQELRTLTDRAVKTDNENVAKLMLLASGDRAETGFVRPETLSALKAQVEIAERGAVTEQEKIQVVQQVNPDATVVSDTVARIMETQGVNLKTAQLRAGIIQRLVDGEQLDRKEINKIDPTNARTKALFTEITGVQFPVEKVPNEQLYAIYRSASQVQQEQAAQVASKLQETEVAQPVQAETAVDIPATEVSTAEAPAAEDSFTLGGETIPYAEGTRDRARQVMAEAMGEVGGDGKPLVSYQDFTKAYRDRFPKAGQADVALAYQQYLKDAGTVDTGVEGQSRMRLDEFRSAVRQVPGHENATDAEIESLFRSLQEANREGYTGVEKLSLSEEERETTRKARQEGKSLEQSVQEARETTRRRELESAAKRIQAVLSKGYGIKEVRVVYDAKGFLAKANASIEDGVLTFNGDKVDSAWAMYWTLGHELTHPAAATDSTLTPDILSTFRSLEQGGYFKDSHDSIDAHREALSELYRPVWEQQKTEQDFDAYVDEELAADMMRTAFQHQRTLDRLAGRTPTILEEAKAKVNRLLSGFRQGKDIRSLAQAKSALETLSERLEKALKTAERQREKDGATRYSVSEDGRVLTTPTGVEVIQNPTDSEYRQLRDEALQEMPWLRGTGEPMLRHTYDEQGNAYYWRADQAIHVYVEPYINKQYKTRTSQQWKWWESPYKDEYPASYDLSKFSLDEEARDVDRLDLNPHNETGNLTEEVRENGIPEPEGYQGESVRNGRDAGRAAGSVQRELVREGGSGVLAEGRNPGREDLGVSSGGLKPDPKPHLFARALNAAIQANPNGEMVDFHDSMELSKMKRFMSENGGYGVAVESDGNITAVFNNYSVSLERGVVLKLLLTALENGGTKLDCYATYAPNDLTSKYAKLGFVPVAWMRFNPEYAKEGWHHGEPDVVFFVHNGDSAEMIRQKINQYPTYTKEDIRKLPEFTDYDEAKAYQESKVQEITKPGERYSFSDVRDMPFADQVELVALNKFNEIAVPGVNRQSQNLTADSNLYVMAEPTDFMRELGYGDYAVVVTQQHIRQMLGRREDSNGKVINEHNHQLTQEQVSRLPELLQNPAMVLKAKGRPESLIFVTTETDYKGRPIIIPVKANGLDAAFDGATGPAHLVTSMYGRDNFATFLQDAADNGEIIYYNEKRADPILAGCGLHRSARLPGISSDTIVGAVQPIVKDPGERKFSFTPEFSVNFIKWYKERYGDSDLTESQLKRAVERAEARALRAEESRQAEATLHKQELQNKDTAWQIYATAQQRNDRRSARERVMAVKAAAKQDRRDQQVIHAAELSVARDEKIKALRSMDTAWEIEHTRKMREQAAESRAKIADAKRLAQREKENAVRETREIERAVADAQHDADRMNERRRAAARLHRSETTWRQKTAELHEKGKLGRKAAREALHESEAASKKRAKETADQAVVSTLRQDPKAMREIRTLQSEASKLRTLGRSAYRNFINVAEAIDRFAKRQPDGIQASTLVTTLGASATTIERIYKDGLVARDGSRIGESMRETFLCLDEKGKTVDESKQALLQDYLLHRHNQDRMDLEGRALRKLEAFETENPWLAEMPREEFARLVAMTEAEQEKQGKKEAHDLAVQYAGLLKAFTESQNKPIFADSAGNAVTAETSRIIADQYLAENPWLEEKANGIYQWWDQFMREWAVGDSISVAEYERMRETYPHYVPTYRAQKNGVGAANFVGAGGANVSKAVKKAKGSFLEVMRVEDSFSNLVSKIVRLERTNELYKNLIDTAIVDPDSVADMIQVDWDTVDQQTQQQFGLDDVQAAAENAETTGIQKTKDGYKLTAWYGGHQVSAYVNEELYKSIAGVTGNLANDLERGLLKVGNALTSPMKTAITGINPNFALRNVSRDLPTAVINSISGMAFPKYWAKAAAEMTRNSEAWQTYQSLGGTHAGYYNDNKGFAHGMSQGFSGRNILEKAGFFNEATEAQTRFAEYLATIDRLGDTYENRLLGIKNSAEVTVDFSRKGRYGKVINAWVPYWNPAVQGIDKVIRSVIEAPDVKSRWIKASKTLGRAAMTTILFEAIQYAVLKATDRDDDWEELSDRTKDTYYCIPLGKDHTFLKIPKNREWGAILGTPFMRILEYKDGRENPFENYLETSITPNFLPPAILRPTSEGIESDIIGVSQALDLARNEDFADRTIVPYAYQEGSKSQQWDNETSWLSKVIGERLNLSPMQLDYLVGDYFGDFGDLYIKATASSTWSGDENAKDIGESIQDVLMNPWLADSRYSNQTVSNYYETMDQLSRTVQDRKNQLGTDAAQETKEYKIQKALNSLYGKQISDLNAKARDMADGEEKDALKAEIAELAGEALTFYQDCMDGKIADPQLTADYADLSPAVSDELIRLNALSEEYKFKPTGNPSSKYTDPKNSQREYILTGDDEAKAKYKEIYWQVYNELTEELMGRERYRKAKDSRKAELLEANREKVLDETRDQFLDWLAENRRSEKKRK